MRKLAAGSVALVAAVAVLVIPAVGVAAPAAAPSVVRVAALKSGLRFNASVLRARHGRIRIVFTNRSSLKHDVLVESGEHELGGTKVIGRGVTSVTLTLKPGTYNFYCSVPGHEDAGMKGRLVVS